MLTRITNRVARIAILGLGASLLAIAPFSPVHADDVRPQLQFSNGRFEPATFKLPAGTPTKLTVKNLGDAAIEFESFELNRERVVQPGQSITVNLPKLDPGQYHFFDDFHHEVAQGTITVH